MITRMVVKDADARLGAHDLEEVKAHPYFSGVEFEDRHMRPSPVLSLVDLCLQKVGRTLKTTGKELDKWEGRASLKPEVQAVLERMQLAQKWQDDVMPPEED